MKYPRLRLAVEQNHKEFVGHMYSQQVLNQVWYGRLENWQEKGLFSKTLHAVILLLLLPGNIVKKLFRRTKQRNMDITENGGYTEGNQEIISFSFLN